MLLCVRAQHGPSFDDVEDLLSLKQGLAERVIHLERKLKESSLDCDRFQCQLNDSQVVWR